MLIHNVRLGFATNSSSTHSIIFLKPRQRIEDSDVDHREFGWDFWTAASQAAKRQYIAIQLYDALRHQVNDDVAEAVVESWVKGYEPSEPGKTFHDAGPAGYIDHQSAMVLPQSWDGKGIDKEFFQEFQAFLMRDDVAILGGNDNTEESHPLGDTSFHLPLPRDGYANLVARKDAKGNFWTVFNRDDGGKVRFSFEDPTSKHEVMKASVPELVDLKITDFCPFGCAFCYQGSTHAGKHADSSVLHSIAHMFSKLKVFEVAIGGGEPTLHPKFLETITTFKAYGVIPNFTTKNLTWLRDPAVWPKVIESIGGFAFTADNQDDVKKLAKILDMNDIDTSKVSVQYVMGSKELHEMGWIIRACAERNLRVTLLGYKTTGRGSSYKPHKYDGWLDMIVKLRDEEKVYVNLGIDTALAKESQAALKKAKIHHKLYATDEGMFSMYIDAVEMKMGPSSYVEDVAMKRVQKFDEKSILDTFAGYKKTSWEKLDELPD